MDPIDLSCKPCCGENSSSSGGPCCASLPSVLYMAFENNTDCCDFAAIEMNEEAPEIPYNRQWGGYDTILCDGVNRNIEFYLRCETDEFGEEVWSIAAFLCGSTSANPVELISCNPFELTGSFAGTFCCDPMGGPFDVRITE